MHPFLSNFKSLKKMEKGGAAYSKGELFRGGAKSIIYGCICVACRLIARVILMNKYEPYPRFLLERGAEAAEPRSPRN